MISTSVDLSKFQSNYQQKVALDHNEIEYFINKLNCPKLMVCHDMKGNYLNDKWNLGSIFGNAYQILHWKHVDLFCYFSHNFITVPPKLWVNNCHRHGVKVIGTVITEWEAGYNVCCSMFTTTFSALEFAEKLIIIAMQHNLDGWLINIENKLDQLHISNVLLFLQTLTAKLHLYKSYSEVIW